jgi:hypothetical protein
VVSLAVSVVAARRALAPICVVVGVLAFGCHGVSNALVELDEARSLAASARVQFNKADDASNRAVMADTDEASIAFARDAEKATQRVDRDVATLAAILRRLGLPRELRGLQEFQQHFSEYKKLDREILVLAVENTNLKAQHLSFGPARKAADEFRDSLGAIVSRFPAKDRCRADQLVAQATLAVREIQVLEAPHIASPSDAEMTRMEQEMAALDRRAREAVNALDAIAPPDARALPAAALAALDRLKEVRARLVALSRRNSNVRSFDLALRSKPPLVNACDDSLRALQEALANEGSKATR